MKRAAAFSLMELLAVVVILAVLINFALPYYQDYVKEAKLAKALEDLNLMARVLMADRTEGQGFYITDNVPSIFNNKLTHVQQDPWGRNYEINQLSGYLKSLGPDPATAYDDIVVYYEPTLALSRARLGDQNGDGRANIGEKITLYFTKTLRGQNSAPPNTQPLATPFPALAPADLLFSGDMPTPGVDFQWSFISTGTTYIFQVLRENCIQVGQTQVGIHVNNTKFLDCEGIPALGTNFSALNQQKLMVPIKAY